VSTGSLAPSTALFPSARIGHGTADSACAPALGANPATRFQRRVIAELALAELERTVDRLQKRLDPVRHLAASVPRRSRRSAWWSID
jgi:hypothetical protein